MKKNGFTLLELLVTVAILAILMSMVVGILININKVNVKTAAEQKLDNSLSRTLEIIKRTVRQAQGNINPNPPLQPRVNGNTLTVIIGDVNTPQTVNFVYSPPTATRSGIIYVNNPADIIGENLTKVDFKVADARRFSDTPLLDNPGTPTLVPVGTNESLYMGGNTLVKVTLVATIKVPGEADIVRTVSDSIITRVGISQ